MRSSDWSYDSLYNKAQLYIDRALQSDRNGALFPFWSSLTLELIARATLSKIHPVLIADPREGHHILHAFGFPPKKGTPKTIGAKTIFSRLQIMLPDFKEEEEAFCQSFINMRNEELHTGTPIFEDYSTDVWLTPFYRTLKILLQHQSKTLEEFLGKGEANIAEQMIGEKTRELVSKVKNKVNQYKNVFHDLEHDERKEKVNNVPSRNHSFIVSEHLYGKYRTVACPSCNNTALVIGKYISQSEPKVVDDTIEIQHNMLPVKLKCFSCGLKLESNGELSAISLGGQFAINQSFDPIEYYDIEIEVNSGTDISDYEYDYGND